MHARYNVSARFLHWLTAAIWLFVWFAGMLAVYARDWINPAHGLTIAHKALAITLIILVPLRILWRLRNAPPALPDSFSPQMESAARLGHLAIYLIALVLLPLSGWLWSSVADKPVMFLWLVQVPPLTAPHLELYDLAKWVHTGLAWLSGVLIGGHILMAFKHKWLDHDGVFETMWPRRR